MREVRVARGIAQGELAKRSGLRRDHVAAIERGEVDPTFLTLVRIARALEAPLAELMERYERLRAERG